ncbi:MAG: hypothetical protein EOO03_03810, partial [Chitinophagaceae bacterium]
YNILQKKEYLFYASYLMLLCIYYLLAIPELFFNINLSDKQAIAKFDLFKRPVQFLISVAYSFFVMYYLGLRQRSLPLYRIFIFLIVLYCVLSAACLVGNVLSLQYDPVYYIIGLMLFPLQLYVVVALFKYKVAYARYIIWGSIIVLVGSCVTLMISLSLTKDPNSVFTNATAYIPVMLSVILDIFLFTVALQHKVADNEKSLINAALGRQQAVMMERERIIADLHDDVGGGLSSIRMMSDLMGEQDTPMPADTYTKYSRKISSTAKEIAQRMNTIIWSLNMENDSLQSFAEYVRQYGVSFFEGSSIQFQCNVAQELPLHTELSGVLRKNLFLIIKEALHNTLKHSQASSATLDIGLTGNNLELIIADNGTGISGENRFGNGQKNMQKRVDEIHGTLLVSSQKGTRILVTAPL